MYTCLGRKTGQTLRGREMQMEKQRVIKKKVVESRARTHVRHMRVNSSNFKTFSTGIKIFCSLHKNTFCVTIDKHLAIVKHILHGLFF